MRDGSWHDALQHPGFVRLAAVRAASQGGDGAFQAAIAGAVFFNPTHATSARSAALGFTVLLLPYSVIGPSVGRLIDRWRRAPTLRSSAYLRGGLALAAAATTAIAGPDSVAFAVVALLVLSVGRFAGALVAAALPHVVDDIDLVPGNSLAQTVGYVASLGGGGLSLAIGGLLRASGGRYPMQAVVAALLYGVCAVLLARVTADALGPDPATAAARAADPHITVRQALASIANDHQVRQVLGALTLLRLGYGAFTLSTVLLYRNGGVAGHVAGGALTGIAAAFAAAAVGVLAASAITPRLARAGVMLPAVLATSISGLALLPLIAIPPAWLLVLAAFGFGCAGQMLRIRTDATIQLRIADDHQGRVFALTDVVFNLGYLAGILAAAGGTRPTGVDPLIAGVLAVALIASGCYLTLRPAS